jgi:thiosulfate reductase cytochrome b subunit
MMVRITEGEQGNSDGFGLAVHTNCVPPVRPFFARLGVRIPPMLPRHRAIVRLTHWSTTLCALALLVSGIEIVISHPRFYWGETGNVNTPTLFSIPIPSSRETVPTGYDYVLPDANGWSRYLHFEAAWALVLTGAVYLLWGFFSRHFGRNLLPRAGVRSWWTAKDDSSSYNQLQRLAYLIVIFGLFPLLIWTGLAMSPAFDSAVPAAVAVLGGRQSARTLHFLLTVSLVLFVLVHVVMVWLAGFRNRVAGMITGRVGFRQERV